MKVALVYDRINKWGGAERVLLHLHKLYPQAPLYTLVHNSKTASWANSIRIIPSFFNKLGFLRTRHELLAPISSYGFESFNFDQYDVVISITSDTAKAIITKPNTLHICYCLTPTRYLWSGQKDYENPLLHMLKKSLQKQDFIQSHRPDHYLSISKEVQKRVEDYYHQESEVLYPAIDFNFWSELKRQPDKATNYLLVSRLVPYKKADLVIKAFNQLPNLSLKIVGIGSQITYLKSIAKPNIEFLGNIDDDKLRSLYARSKALISPQKEDFGLVPLEAQATGTPVIAYKSGGALETIVDGKTGLYFDEQNVDSLIHAVKIFEEKTSEFHPTVIRANAQKFSEDLFLREFSDKVESLYETYRHRRRAR